MKEGEIYGERESKKKNGKMRRALLEHGELEVAHSAFIRALLQREYIPYFRRVLGERLKKRRSKEKKKENIEIKGDIEGRKKTRQGGAGEGGGEREAATFLSPKRNIFFVCKMMLEIAIITIITEASNNERSILRARGI